MTQISLNYHLKNLFELLAIPSISAQKEYKGEMLKAANWIKNKLNSLNFDANILKTSGHPVVYAESLKAGSDKPTLLIYGHYDVQDPGNLLEWSSKPFQPEVRSGNVYARGAADDKGQLYTWISAIEEIGKRKDSNFNIKFIIEGEEEVGSKNMDDFVGDNLALLKSDICLISDTHCLSEHQPVITAGLRGILYYQLKIKSLNKDVHSGTYGGNVANPANIMASIISKIKDENKKIIVPGFYENVRKLSKREIKRLMEFPFTKKEVTKESGAKNTFGETSYSVQERVSTRPTFDVNGIWSGYLGEGEKTIIPAEAYAKFSMRLVPNQTCDDLAEKFEDYIKSIMPDEVDYELERTSSGEPVLFDTKSKFFKIAEYVYKKTFENKPLYFSWGGSIPVTAIFKKRLGIDSVLMGYGLPDDGLHSPNEKLSLSMFEKGIKTNIKYLKNIY
jgi:acetylornithine deacetylase/succinyl-diaminopimelate desuccinylase-like protein